ncbi:MAG TPA: iron-sulfur cluster assembly accessory protein [Gammaproteobacteria bacterium]|nr:iron-sulfur cluster assembly accessory protein [Gammaproteobacteria bacterium]
MAITLTTAAADRVRGYLEKSERALGLRFGVKTSGCSGFSYTVELAESIDEQDQVFESQGVKVVVNSTSLPYVDGTEIDFNQDELSAAFAFNNPRVSATCGCGESFSII